jgi:hypothetical protein
MNMYFRYLDIRNFFGYNIFDFGDRKEEERKCEIKLNLNSNDGLLLSI